MRPCEIQIQLTTQKHRVSLARLKLIIKKIFKCLHVRQRGLSVLLVGDRRMATLNWRFLKHKGPTDVIAFPVTGKSKGACHHLNYLLGDIVISLDTTKRQAKHYGNSFDYELAFYLCHGILHLLGHKDKTKKQRADMLQKQAQILKRIGIKK